MDERDYREAKRACYLLAAVIGANGREQQMLMDTLKGIEKHQINDRLGLAMMLGVFYDGLQYGNWPWTSHNVSEIVEEN